MLRLFAQLGGWGKVIVINHPAHFHSTRSPQKTSQRLVMEKCSGDLGKERLGGTWCLCPFQTLKHMNIYLGGENVNR